jgi:hypothetical protein
VATGNEPPWAWYQYMKLIETVAAIQTSRAAVAGVSASVQTEVPVSPPKREAVTDIGARRRQRRRDDDDDDDEDEDPSLPM